MPAIRGAKSKKKTKRHTRDLDQIHEDLLSKKHLTQYTNTKAAEDLPGLGQWYCIECAKWFEGEDNLQSHKRGKPHKRRLKQLQEDPHTQREAEAAIGLRTDNGRLTTLEEGMRLDSRKGNAAEDSMQPSGSKAGVMDDIDLIE